MTPASNQGAESIINLDKLFGENVTKSKLFKNILSADSALNQLMKRLSSCFRSCREYDETIQMLEELNIDKHQTEDLSCLFMAEQLFYYEKTREHCARRA